MTKSKRKLTFKPVNQKITRREFAAMHYKHEEYDTDSYYVNFANKVLLILNDTFKDDRDLVPHYTRKAALMIAGYLEDVIAENNIFKAFMSLHAKKYGKQLPFYDLEADHTFKDELPSMSIIRFLLWYVFNDAQPDTLINPCNPFIEMTALAIGLETLTALQEAPETPIRPEILPEEECGIPEYFQIREMCWWLLNECYLTRTDKLGDLQDSMSSMLDQSLNLNKDIDDSQLAYASYSYIPFNSLIGPLAITPQEWLAEIVELNPSRYEKKFIRILKELKSQPYDIYKYTRVNKKSATLLTVNGNEIKFSAYTIPGQEMPDEINKGQSAYMSLVYYDGNWMQNGLAVNALPETTLTETMKEYKEKSKQQKLSFEYNMKRLKNKRIGVFANYDEYMANFPDSKDLPYTNDSGIDLEDLNDVNNLLYFINEEGTVSLIPNVGDSIKIRGNKYYNKAEAADNGVGLIMGDLLPDKEIRQYIVDNKLIPDAEMCSVESAKAGRDLFQNNMRYLLDYTSRDTLIINPATHL